MTAVAAGPSVAEPPVAAGVMPGARWAFADRIDLMDESLREGAERASVPPDLDAKCDLARAIADVGIRTLVVGMFPDVPQNAELLARLVRRQQAGQLPADLRFMVISHVGVTMRQTLALLDELAIPLDTVHVIAIHSVSDLQITHLFPTILRKDGAVDWDQAAWEALDDATRRARNLDWLAEFLPVVTGWRGGGVMVGLLDAFRADHGHLMNAVATVAAAGIRQIRLVDTAGTCLPHQLPQTVGEPVARFPDIAFYGHFHDDFGMSTANAVMGLSLGLKGVDVSVGGFANRAGHPPLAEVVMALRKLYGVELPGVDPTRLHGLSRMAERIYGLMENPAQAITGVVTHSVQSGIRTELLRKAPRIFDAIAPEEVGARLVAMFGVRSGRDGLLRFLRERQLLAPFGLEPTPEIADALFEHLDAEWARRSAGARARLGELIEQYQDTLNASFFTEEAMTSWLSAHLTAVHMKTG